MKLSAVVVTSVVIVIQKGPKTDLLYLLTTSNFASLNHMKYKLYNSINSLEIFFS